MIPKGKDGGANGKYEEVVLGCRKAEERAEWMSLLQILQSCQGQFNMR